MSTRKTKRDYAQERLDPRWQKKRLEIMNRDSFACCDCGDEETTLNVHHRYYVTGRKPWRYPNWSLQTLCYPCHQNKHDNGENDSDYENLTEEEKWCEEPWEMFTQWMFDAAEKQGFLGSIGYEEYHDLLSSFFRLVEEMESWDLSSLIDLINTIRAKEDRGAAQALATLAFFGPDGKKFEDEK